MDKPIYSLILLIVALIIGFSVPLVAPVIGVVLIIWGIQLSRHNTNKGTRIIAAIAIGGGIVIIVLCILMALGLTVYTTSSTTDDILPLN